MVTGRAAMLPDIKKGGKEMNNENNISPYEVAEATAAVSRDIIILLFAIYAFTEQVKEFSLMANLAIVIPHLANAVVELRKRDNRNIRKILELVSIIFAIIDISIIIVYGETMMQKMQNGVIILPTKIAIVLSACGLFRSFMVLISDYMKADFGIYIRR